MMQVLADVVQQDFTIFNSIVVFGVPSFADVAPSVRPAVLPICSLTLELIYIGLLEVIFQYVVKAEQI